MENKGKKYVLSLIFVLLITVFLIGCTQNEITKSYGGNMTIELPSDTKLEEITWKENSIWYLTRPMRDDEEAETHTFQQDSPYGIIEGTVTIVEYKGDDQNE